MEMACSRYLEGAEDDEGVPQRRHVGGAGHQAGDPRQAHDERQLDVEDELFARAGRIARRRRLERRAADHVRRADEQRQVDGQHGGQRRRKVHQDRLALPEPAHLRHPFRKMFRATSTTLSDWLTNDH